MMYDQLVRRVQKILRRESPYRYDEYVIRAAIADIAARMCSPEKQRKKIVRRAAECVKRGGR